MLTIVSGGQTGVDRAALDVAAEVGLPASGWCPAGRWAEDGRIPGHYALRESATSDPAERTRLNVHDSDATLLLGVAGTRSPGSELAVRYARELGRPVHRRDVLGAARPAAFRRWMQAHGVRRLNVAGPRESERPGIYGLARDLLRVLLGPYGSAAGRG